jgi:hypothetical protein
MDTLLDRLDDLWKAYLDHLDKYQEAQSELSKHLKAVGHKSRVTGVGW